MSLLQRSVNSLRQGVLAHLRIDTQFAQAVSLQSWRGFADASYLDKKEVESRVLNVVTKFDKVDPSKVNAASAFQKDLGLDSLDTVELVMALEEEFNLEIPDSEADKILSCSDAITYVAQHPMAK